MEVKKDILWRVYLSYILIVIVCLVVFARTVYIQQFQGDRWRKMSDSLHLRVEEIDPERGTIYSEDGKMLSTSIPQFDIYIDFSAPGLRDKSGKLFRANIDSLCYCLSTLFGNEESYYKSELVTGYQKKLKGYLLKSNVSYRDYQTLMQFPLVRLGRFKSGFVAHETDVRLNPYGLWAYRTIGLDRAKDNQLRKIGLEQTYDSVLKGISGKRPVRYIAGGVSMPIGEFEVEPENGKDIVTTLDVFIQEVTETALLRMMQKNEAESGCAIVMETKSGKIKAIANLGKVERIDTATGLKKPSYAENFNYALTPAEPGSTFKLATMMSLLEDKKITLDSPVNLNKGKWVVNGDTVFDSEEHGRTLVTAKQAFELSSNVGMAKLVYSGYKKSPERFTNHLHELHLDTTTGIDITGERNSVIYKPGNKSWSFNTLLWMSFGYHLTMTPLQTITFYNAIANKGKMMRPYLLNAVKDEGDVLQERSPQVAIDRICSESTVNQLQKCLEGVCSQGTAAKLFEKSLYKVAGKTGTALVANGAKGYRERRYQSSFVGYFPAEDPEYTCIVVIKNRLQAPVFYGAAVAGPVFKEIADRLYIRNIRKKNYATTLIKAADSSLLNYVGLKYDIKQILGFSKIPFIESSNASDEIVTVTGSKGGASFSTRKLSNNRMPQLKGMGLKDAVIVAEGLGLKVNVKGKGKVLEQSISEGAIVAHGQVLNVQLN